MKPAKALWTVANLKTVAKIYLELGKGVYGAEYRKNFFHERLFARNTFADFVAIRDVLAVKLTTIKFVSRFDLHDRLVKYDKWLPVWVKEDSGLNHGIWIGHSKHLEEGCLALEYYCDGHLLYSMRFSIAPGGIWPA